MGKEKKEKKEKVEGEDGPAPAVCAIAKPLAGEKLVGKVLKVVKKAAKRKQMKRGVKEVRSPSHSPAPRMPPDASQLGGDDVRRARALQRLFSSGRRYESTLGRLQGIAVEPYTPPLTSTLAAANPDGGGTSGVIIATHHAGGTSMSPLRRSMGSCGLPCLLAPDLCLPKPTQRRPSLESACRCSTQPTPRNSHQQATAAPHTRPPSHPPHRCLFHKGPSIAQTTHPCAAT